MTGRNIIGQIDYDRLRDVANIILHSHVSLMLFANAVNILIGT